MSSKTTFLLLLGLIVFVLGLGVATVVIGDGLLAKKSSELAELKIESQALDQQQALLNNAKRDLVEFAELEATAKSIVPQDKDQARTIREILAIANEAQIPIDSITFPNSNLGEAVKKSGSSSSNSSPITQATPVAGVKGLFQIEINLNIGAPVSYEQLINFLEKLEQNRRTAQVTALSINPDTDDRNFVNFNVSINVYIKP